MLLIFGSDSFVAKNIQADIKISKTECDLTNFEEIVSVLKKYKPDSIINCSAAHGSASLMSKNHSYYLDKNISMDSNVLKAANKLNISNVVLLSSVSAFPSIFDHDLDESDLYEGEVNQFNFGYNTSKRIAFDLCKSYQLDYNKNYKVLFLGNLYGKYGKFSKESNVLNAIIYQMYEAHLANKDLYLYGTGEDVRAFTFVEDLNKILVQFCINPNLKSCIFSSNEVASIKNLTEVVSKNLLFKGKVYFSGEDNGGQKRKVASSLYLLEQFPELMFTNLSAGIKMVTSWYVKSFGR
jgi:GDP-L-fucose synthase